MHNQEENLFKFQIVIKDMDVLFNDNIRDGEPFRSLPKILFNLCLSKSKNKKEEISEKETDGHNTNHSYTFDKLNNIELECIIIDYFSNILSNSYLHGVDEFLFMALSDDIKIKIYDRISY